MRSADGTRGKAAAALRPLTTASLNRPELLPPSSPTQTLPSRLPYSPRQPAMAASERSPLLPTSCADDAANDSSFSTRVGDEFANDFIDLEGGQSTFYHALWNALGDLVGTGLLATPLAIGELWCLGNARRSRTSSASSVRTHTLLVSPRLFASPLHSFVRSELTEGRISAYCGWFVGPLLLLLLGFITHRT